MNELLSEEMSSKNRKCEGINFPFSLEFSDVVVAVSVYEEIIVVGDLC